MLWTSLFRLGKRRPFSMQGPPRQRKSIEIRTWGRALKAVPAKQENKTETVSSACVFWFPEEPSKVLQTFQFPPKESRVFPWNLLRHTLCYLELERLENHEQKVTPDMFQPDFMDCDRKLREGLSVSLVPSHGVEHKLGIVLCLGHWNSS